MKQRWSIGAIRLLALTSARPIRLGRSLMTMIWHRPTRPARAATTLRNAKSATYRTTNIHLRCNFNWQIAAVHQSKAAGLNVERSNQPIFQLGKVAARAGINRFRLQTERLWLGRMRETRRSLAHLRDDRFFHCSERLVNFSQRGPAAREIQSLAKGRYGSGLQSSRLARRPGVRKLSQ